VQEAFLSVSICTSRSELTWINWVIWMAPEPFLKAMMGDERIRTLGDAWQHAIGNRGAWHGTTNP
jgi:hypothetical protein